MLHLSTNTYAAHSLLVPAALPCPLQGADLVVDGVVGATGLELKSDPGVPMVYAGRCQLSACPSTWRSTCMPLMSWCGFTLCCPAVAQLSACRGMPAITVSCTNTGLSNASCQPPHALARSHNLTVMAQALEASW